MPQKFFYLPIVNLFDSKGLSLQIWKKKKKKKNWVWHAHNSLLPCIAEEEIFFVVIKFIFYAL